MKTFTLTLWVKTKKSDDSWFTPLYIHPCNSVSQQDIDKVSRALLDSYTGKVYMRRIQVTQE